MKTMKSLRTPALTMLMLTAVCGCGQIETKSESQPSAKDKGKAVELTADDICVIDATYDSPSISLYDAANLEYRPMLIKPTCYETERVKSTYASWAGFFGVASLTCTVAPEPVSKVALPFLATATATAGALTFIADQWPCEGPRKLKEKEQRAVEKVVCEMMDKKYKIKDKKGYCK